MFSRTRVNSFHAGLFCMRFLSTAVFFQKNLAGILTVSKSLDPDQARHFVGPDLGINCLQRFSAVTIIFVAISRERLILYKFWSIIG